jgi:aminopeptidase N
MLQTLLGAEGFRKGSDLYFDRHDGTAATCDDFVKAMEDATGTDLTQFRLWYAQAGTPVIRGHGIYDAAARTYDLTLTQTLPDTPGQAQKKPMHIPVTVGLVGRKSGADLATSVDGRKGPSHVLALTQASQVFRFSGVAEEPVPSIGRGFSAPARFEMDLTPDDRAFLMARDSDPFNRWEAGQKLATEVLLRMTADARAGRKPVADPRFVSAFGDLLADMRRDPAFTAMAAVLPSEMELSQVIDEADPDAIHVARETLRRELSATYRGKLHEIYASLKSNEPYAPDAVSAGRRSLRNTCLRYLTAEDTETTRGLAAEHFRSADNMTDSVAGLACLVDMTGKEGREALDSFYDRWKANPLVIDKWMSIQAQSSSPETLERIRALTGHPAFNIANPNRVRSLIGAFVMGNPLRFHAADGSGYAFLADTVLKLDGVNPQVAARLCGAFETWRRFDTARQASIRGQLARIAAVQGLSRNVSEIVEKTLG